MKKERHRSAEEVQHPHDDDTPTSDKPTDNLPAFDGNEFGRDSETRGHPYWQKLKADLAWEYPQILNATGTPVGCIHLTADGKIPETTMHRSQEMIRLDDAVERALKKGPATQKPKPDPGPGGALEVRPTKWVCFKFDIKTG